MAATAQACIPQVHQRRWLSNTFGQPTTVKKYSVSTNKCPHNPTYYRGVSSRDQNDVVNRKSPFLWSSNAMNSVVVMQQLSAYAEDLPSDAKAWNREKLEVIGGYDPFLSGRIGELVDRLPDVEPSDLVSYLVLQTSFILAKQYKARKGLEAYNQFVCGWVKDVCCRRVCGKYLITSWVSKPLNVHNILQTLDRNDII